MIKSGAQSARAADAKSDSTAQRVPSGPTLYRLGCAVLRAARLNRLPRNPCSSGRGDTRRESLPTSGGKSSGCNLQSRKQPLDGSADTAPAKSSVSALSSARMTRVHPTPGRGLRLPQASRRVRANHSPFFNPRGDCVTRDAEGARQPAQGTPLIISAKDLFALLFGVSVAARLLSTASVAVAAQITLAAIRSQAVTHQPFALAMLTSQSNSDHD